jgi:hypothetical protein
MIWLTWRQFRAQALGALGGLAALGIYLVLLGLAIRHSYNNIAGCQAQGLCEVVERQFKHRYEAQLGLTGVLLIAVPGLIGTFWGAPLVTRELETGTHRLVWNQSITRTRWLAVKLGLIALVAAAVTGLCSLLLTWAASPFDRLEGNRFAITSFDSRNLTPLGYAVFAFVLGTTIGLIIRRTLPAMALTVVIFAVIQIVMPFAIRPHLLPAEHSTVALNSNSMSRINGLFTKGDRGSGGPFYIQDYQLPGAWVLTGESPVLDSAGKPMDGRLIDGCIKESLGLGPESAGGCLAKLNTHINFSFQPASRYWPFQLVETAVFLALAAALAGFCFWRIPRGLA